MVGKGISQLGDLVKLVRGTTYSSSRLGEPGPVLLGLASINRNGGFRADNLKTYGGPSAANLLLRPGDLFVSLKDVTQSADLLGSIARVPAEVKLGRITQDTVKLEIKPGTNREFIYWTLRTPQYRSYCRAHATGTTNLGLPRKDFLAFTTPEPTADRLALVGLLEKLDDKVELNRRLAETLEATSRALFQSWFIDFDPIHAKVEGRSTGLAPEVAAQFPKSFGEGGLPEGWQSRPLPALAHFLNGLALQKYPAQDDEPSLPVIKIAELRTGPTPKSGRASKNVPAAYHVRDGDHLFSWSGSLTHCLWSHGPGALNQHLFKVSALNEIPDWLVYQAVEHHMPDFQAIASGKAVTMGHIQRHHLDQATVACPPSSTLRAMDAIMSPLHSRSLAAALQSRMLSEVRDTLLPKLISGELGIAEAEQRIAAA